MQRLPRSSGLLVHPTSLPGRHGIGDLGRGTFAFLEFLARARQTLWQVLPLTPTGYGNSPYSAPSAFAGNPLLISLDALLEQGLLDPEQVQGLSGLPEERVDFDRLIPLKHAALRAAHARFLEGAASRHVGFERFKEAEGAWLEDWALFAALKDREGSAWTAWDPRLRDRDPVALGGARADLARDIDFHAFSQYLFFTQWRSVREQAHAHGIRVVGDIPIFVALDSADVWVNRSLFKLAPDGQPLVVAGVPPDYFSATGQLWGNPLYDWDASAADGHRWWVARFRHLLRKVDVIRIDHFRGFQAAWEVPADADTAVRGAWVAGPGAELFHGVDRSFEHPVPIVAEDLGLITDEVRALLAGLGYPGMKVLQFAFGGGSENAYLPHAFDDPNCVVYTGTHDNDTTRGWYEAADARERDHVRRYLGRDGRDIAWDLVRLALQSTADTAIVPLQDVLDLGSACRMNTPGAADGNWQWRTTAQALAPDIADRLADLTAMYGRAAAPKESASA